MRQFPSGCQVGFLNLVAHTLPCITVASLADHELEMHFCYYCYCYSDTLCHPVSCLPGLQTTPLVTAPFRNASNDGRQLDIILNITLTPPTTASGNNSTFEAGVMLIHDSTTSTRVLLNGTMTQANNTTWAVSSLGVFVNRTLSGGATNTTYQGGFEGGAVSVPSGGLALDDLQLRVLFDHSLLEVYANQGRGRIASRVYPLSNDAWTVSMFATMQLAGSGIFNAAIYAMDSCWVDSV